jgi:hypothetical protein
VIRDVLYSLSRLRVEMLGLLTLIVVGQGTTALSCPAAARQLKIACRRPGQLLGSVIDQTAQRKILHVELAYHRACPYQSEVPDGA